MSGQVIKTSELIFFCKKRYYAIRNPLQNHGQKRSKFTITIVWIISICLASVQLFVARVQVLEDDEEILTNNKSYYLNSTLFPPKLKPFYASDKIYTCNEVWESTQKQQRYTLFNFFAVYLIPVFFLG